MKQDINRNNKKNTVIVISSLRQCLLLLRPWAALKTQFFQSFLLLSPDNYPVKNPFLNKSSFFRQTQFFQSFPLLSPDNYPVKTPFINKPPYFRQTQFFQSFPLLSPDNYPVKTPFLSKPSYFRLTQFFQSFPLLSPDNHPVKTPFLNKPSYFRTNNLKRGYRGGPGYNGGHGKREALHAMADLLFTARTRFPQAKVVLNSVLIRRDLTYKTLFDFNEQLELMCLNFNVQFVEANCCVGRRDFARDGIHLNRRGVSRPDSLFEDVTAELLLSSTDQAAANVNLSYSPGNEIAVNSDPAVSDAIHESQNSGN
ncbi:hypothetical protein J6590_076360 [Homalodisca vitripennis]|nr:hypothetical protein J6590_076360 [Homalodisca vitripennis]